MIGVALAAVVGGVGLAFAATTSTPDTWAPGDDSDVTLPDDASVSDPTLTDNSMNNRAAMCATLRTYEGGPAGYGALVGGGTFTDFSHHPGFTDASMTAKSAWAGAMNSHAAGAYQFQPATWKPIAQRLGLTDFSPASQDAGAIELIREQGALPSIDSGDFATARLLLAGQWQSLTVRDADVLAQTFTDNGGILA